MNREAVTLLSAIVQVLGEVEPADEHTFWSTVERTASALGEHALDQRIAIEALPWWKEGGFFGFQCRVCAAHVGHVAGGAPMMPNCPACSARSVRCPTCQRWNHHLSTCPLRARD